MSTVTLPSLLEYSPARLKEICLEMGHEAYRASQIREQIFQNRVNSFDEMSNLPNRFRNALAERYVLFSASIEQHLVSRDRTEKILLKYLDGQSVECVLMREEKRRTVCISTQVGCAMGCVFCASGLHGVVRDLTPAEILEQILLVERLLPQEEKLTNLVVMGIGEPLANLENLLTVLETVCDSDGLGLSPRRITISTVGLPEKIRELADYGKPFNLAVSLHSANDKLRNEIVWVNRNIGLKAILDAADYYFSTTGRRLTYEYVLLKGVNDSLTNAGELAGLLRGRNAHVNLIPMNDVDELDYRGSSMKQVKQFAEKLEREGINVTTRKRKGEDIAAACGQLRLQDRHSKSRAR